MERLSGALKDGPDGVFRGRGRFRPEDARVPCLRCGVRLPPRRQGCRGGHCPNCRHPYPHGDCSD